MARLSEEQDLLAAERALHLVALDGETRAEQAAREAWELRLTPLAEAIGPVAPPPGLFAAVEQRIARDAIVVDLAAARRRIAGWRNATLLAGALAAGLAALVVGPLVNPPSAERYVAVVYSDSDPTAPGMIVQIDARAGTATVTPMPLAVPEGRSYEMWQLPQGATRPVSLGLLPENPVLRPRLTARPGDLFAISLEPAGGSPTGQPTQALFHGRAVRVEE